MGVFLDLSIIVALAHNMCIISILPTLWLSFLCQSPTYIFNFTRSCHFPTQSLFPKFLFGFYFSFFFYCFTSKIIYVWTFLFSCSCISDHVLPNTSCMEYILFSIVYLFCGWCHDEPHICFIFCLHLHNSMCMLFPYNLYATSMNYGLHGLCRIVFFPVLHLLAKHSSMLTCWHVHLLNIFICLSFYLMIHCIFYWFYFYLLMILCTYCSNFI